MRKFHKYFRPLYLLFILVVLCPVLKEGMFFDGLSYAAISRNLAEGKGSMWVPFYTQTLHPQFFEHPPLFFWIQSLAFRIFGDSFYVEKLFSLVCVLAILFSMRALLKLVVENKSSVFRLRALEWAAAAYLLSAPVMWGITFNLLDLLLSLLCLLAVYFFVSSLKRKSKLHFMIAFLFVTAAFLCKGPVGLFPLASPALYKIFMTKLARKALPEVFLEFCLLLLTQGLILGIICLNENAFHNLSQYFSQQVGAAISGQIDTLGGTLPILTLHKYLFYACLPGFLLISISVLMYERNLSLTDEEAESGYKLIYFFIALTLVSSLPMAVSHKIREFYLIPSMSFYALAVGLLISRRFSTALKPRARNFFILSKYLSAIALFLTSLYFVFVKEFLRDEVFLKAMRQNGLSQLQGQTLSTCEALAKDYALAAYLQRYHKISLQVSSEEKWTYVGRSCDTKFPFSYGLK